MTNKKQLFFDHIPKSAGTSITNALENILGGIYRLPEISNPHAAYVSNANEKRSLAGHIWFRPNETLNNNYYYCTVLRDPVDRFLSQYFFNKSIAAELLSEKMFNDPRLSDPQVAAAVHLSLEDYLNSELPNLISTYTNIQAIHFAQRKCNQPRDLSEADLLAAAISSLEDYDLVGTFDQLQSFVNRVSDDFSRPYIELSRFKVTPNRKIAHEISASLIQKLKEANQVDTKLIDWAIQRFKLKNSGVSIVVTDNTNLKDHTLQTSEKSIGSVNTDEKVGFGSKDIEIIRVVCIAQTTGNNVMQSGDELAIQISCDAHVLEPDLTVGISVRDISGRTIYGTNSSLLGESITISKTGQFRLIFKLKAILGIGQYSVIVALHQGVSHHEGCYHWIDDAASFAVVDHRESIFQGIVNLDAILICDEQ